nr:hypothetical protein MFLOJ_17820 [Mycobacterium florentinum]
MRRGGYHGLHGVDARLLSLLDAALDRSIVGGYTRIGYQLRSWGWPQDPQPHALKGKAALVTGANRGIGKAIAKGLAQLGASVLLTVRDETSGELARKEIVDANQDADVQVEVCDVADLSAVREFAADRHEVTLATHVLGPALLTECLLPVLRGAENPRVILMSSGGMYTHSLPTDDPEYFDEPYRGATAYARTKRMQVVLTPILARHWADDGVRVYSMHPGWSDTPGVAASLPAFRALTGPLSRTPEQGVDTAIWLAATDPAPPSGGFWHDWRPRPEHYLPWTRHGEQEREHLWRYCAYSAGIDNAWAQRSGSA